MINETTNQKTGLRVRPGQFIVTPAVANVATRALRYLQSGYSVHLRGPAGTGKTTMALHLANLLDRPMMLIFGDDQFTSADLIGSQSGYTQKKLVDNFIHNVLKVEDELKQTWVDSRLTVACREGLTLIYDEFNRSRPEVNNVLLSVLEEKLLALPPTNNRPEYLHVHPDFRAIFTSNPDEYCGVHATQDALMDRLITINMPEPDELTQASILVQKIEVSREEAHLIVNLVKNFRLRTGSEKTSGLRSSLMIAKVCAEHEISINAENSDFRDICNDVLLSRSDLPFKEATTHFWGLFKELIEQKSQQSNSSVFVSAQPSNDNPDNLVSSSVSTSSEASTETKTLSEPSSDSLVPHEIDVYKYLQQGNSAGLIEIQTALGISRIQVQQALLSLLKKGVLSQQNHLFVIPEPKKA